MYPIIDMKATGNRLREIMRIRKISVKDLQQYLGLSCVQSIYHWLNGMSMPTLDNLYAMSALFHVSIDKMICGTRDNNEFFRPKYLDARQRRLLEYYHKLTDCNRAA